MAMALVAFAGASSGATLTAKLVIGLDDEPVLDDPCDIAWGADGTCYVLNCGSNDVSVFDDHWTLQRHFGRQGAGPGEFDNPMGFCVDAHEIRIYEMSHFDIYSLAGVFQESVHDLPVGSSPFSIGETIALITGYESRATVHWNHGREGAATFQLPTGMNRHWQLVAPPPGRGDLSAVAVDLHDGMAYEISRSYEVGRLVDLGLGRGQEWSGGGKDVLSDICQDDKSGYWILHYPRRGHPGQLHLYSHEFESIGKWELGDMRVGLVRISPKGELCLVGPSESVMYICEKPTVR
jgi:6-bladed beta-propeller